ncbi:hypothetical protein TGME49_269640 [Toxoplasma gondii ME49]|uniref:Uncharacterized protein n=1 Tax=Toxoplasma gondii (strain ATCC 50611 / Me49) TaxID=508771 RepID=S8F4H1_TOXGM|nr:hypothetical protein TGME49_269640 [Toxoplasma gondii ME49]EPT28348.1 hypothetical protein TGME49_269640 [Toxoplasma gondii ME49]|eukprot:XP_002365645.1 hypothetical protein TGME49_269640 [Toxoplasma gondii ME49]
MAELPGKKGALGSPSPKSRRGFDCIEAIRVFEESVATELKHLKLSQNYQMNPSHVPLITEKVNHRKSHEAEVPHLAYIDITKKVQEHLQPSIQKLSFPETSSQEVGWIVLKELEDGTEWRHDGSTSGLRRPDSEQYWHVPRRSCDITKTGELYFKQMHRNMFQKLDAAAI